MLKDGVRSKLTLVESVIVFGVVGTIVVAVVSVCWICFVVAVILTQKMLGI